MVLSNGKSGSALVKFGFCFSSKLSTQLRPRQNYHGLSSRSAFARQNGRILEKFITDSRFPARSACCLIVGLGFRRRTGVNYCFCCAIARVFFPISKMLSGFSHLQALTIVIDGFQWLCMSLHRWIFCGQVCTLYRSETNYCKMSCWSRLRSDMAPSFRHTKPSILMWLFRKW